MLILISAFSYAVSTVFRYIEKRQIYTLFVVLYCFCHPLIHNYMFLVTKDIIYTAFFIYLIVDLFKLLSGLRSIKLYINTLAASTGMLLFRNDSKYIIVIVFILIGIINKPVRKYVLSFCGSIFLISILIFNVLFPSLYFTPGSTREMLSVPFQQTARYVLYHEDEVTDEERDSIDAVLDYSSLGEKYNPNRSDEVKNTFKEYADRSDLLNYFKTWLKMFFKHPGTYIQATINNYYQYFYPNNIGFMRFSYSWSEECMGRTNNSIALLGQSFSYPEATASIRDFCDKFGDAIKFFPGISILMTPALYTWVLIILLFYGIRRRNSIAISLIVLPLAVLFICILGPCNGNYGRYSYPIVAALPFIVPLFFELLGNTPNQKQQNSELKT